MPTTAGAQLFQQWVREATQELAAAGERFVAAELAAKERREAALAGGGPVPDPAASSGWPALRQEFEAVVSTYYERIGPRLRRDPPFVENTRLYGTPLREALHRMAALAVTVSQQSGLPSAESVRQWVADDVVPGRFEGEMLQRELAATGGDETQEMREAAEAAEAMVDLDGWIAINDRRAYGSDWWKVLDWPAPLPGGAHRPGAGLMTGLYNLFVRSDGDSTVQDALNSPVLIASGIWATSVGREQLQAAVDGDVACRRDILAVSGEPSACNNESRVMRAFGFPICSHYDGRGNVFLAECDCLKQLSLPSMVRLNSVCRDASTREERHEEDSAFADLSKLDKEDCDAMLASDAARGDVERGTTELGKWPVRDINGLRDRVFRNLLYRYAVRSTRRLNINQGTYAACGYVPCSDEESRYAYVDSFVTRSELFKCPPIRCEASINVEWTGGDVHIEGNMLKVRCQGELCMVDGQPKCRNGGRCLRDGTCNCEGTRYRGQFCEQRLPPEDGEEEEDEEGEGDGAAARRQDGLDPERAGDPDQTDQTVYALRRDNSAGEALAEAARDVRGRLFERKLLVTGVSVGVAVVVAITVLSALRRVLMRSSRVRRLAKAASEAASSATDAVSL